MDRPPRFRHAWLADIIWLLLLAAYVLAGLSLVPLHGDETSRIRMSRDWVLFAMRPDWSQLYYTPDPPIEEVQEQRIANGPVSRYSIGIAWMLAGFQPEDIPQDDWSWLRTWEENEAAGHIPDERLLQVARLSATVSLLGGVAGLFWLGFLLGGRPAAYVASGLLATDPIVLLHGRRAMAEGPLLGFGVLAIAGGAYYLSNPDRFPRLRQQAGWMVLLGVLVGLTFSAKHNGAIVGLALGLVLGIVQVARDRWRGLGRAAWQVGLIALVALGLSFALVPAFWPAPLVSIPEAWRFRDKLAHDHAAVWGGYQTPADRLAGIGKELFAARPAYFEEPHWAEYIGQDIQEYEASPLAGLPPSPATDVIRGGLAVFGLAALVYHLLAEAEGCATAGLALAWLVLTLGLTYQFILLDWQRYYTPALPIMILLQAYGLVRLVGLVSGLARRTPQPG